MHVARGGPCRPDEYWHRWACVRQNVARAQWNPYQLPLVAGRGGSGAQNDCSSNACPHKTRQAPFSYGHGDCLLTRLCHHALRQFAAHFGLSRLVREHLGKGTGEGGTASYTYTLIEAWSSGAREILAPRGAPPPQRSFTAFESPDACPTAGPCVPSEKGPALLSRCTSRGFEALWRLLRAGVPDSLPHMFEDLDSSDLASPPPLWSRVPPPL